MEKNNSCCCCLLRPADKHLKTQYTHSGKTEIYANMFKECFEIHLTSLSRDDMCGICEVCVVRLRDASEFKLQVQRSQAKLQIWKQRDLQIKEEEEDSVKPEMSDEDIGQEDLIYCSEVVKSEILVDPLPIAKDEEFKDVMLGLETRASDVRKHQRVVEVTIKGHSTEFSHATLGSGIVEVTFKRDTKSKKASNGHHSCNTCGQEFARQTALRTHKRTHKNSKFSCDVCNEQFKSPSKEHKRIHTDDKPYTCDICNTRFATKKLLSRHKLLHTGEKPFTCDICKNQFRKKQHLIYHMGTHPGQKRFRCECCARMFLEHNLLRAHVKKYHSKSIGYTCEQCKKIFLHRNALVRHLNKVHNKSKKLSCDLCEMKLSRMSSLKRHIRIHTQEKPYPCKLCNRQYRYKHCLNAHIQTHTGDKPHCCEVCGKQCSVTISNFIEISFTH